MENGIPFQKSEDRTRLESFFATSNPGEYLTYQEIQELTGVEMDARGKSYMRAALRAANIEYICHRGEGIKLASTDTTMPILASRIGRVDSALKRTQTTHDNLAEYAKHLAPEEMKRYVQAGAALGAMLTAADAYKHEYLARKRRERPIAQQVTIPLPQ